MNRILNLLIVISILVCGVALVSGFLFFQTKSSAEWIAHAQQVLYMQSEVYSNLQDMNLSSRGYALTNDSTILGPYKNGKNQLNGNLQKLKELTAENQVQKESLDSLAESAKEFQETTDRLIETHSSKDVPSQKTAMDRIRTALSDISKEEKRQLTLRNEQLNLYYTVGWAALLGQVILSLILLLSSRHTIKRYATESSEKIEELEKEVEQRKRSESELSATATKLSLSNNDLQQFAYVASHDLQEPLRAVTGFLTLLARREAQLDADSQKYITHAVEGAQRMRVLINDLLAYARVESRGRPPELFQMSAALEQAKLELESVIESSGTKISSKNLPLAWGDARQFALVFENLISNAIKFHGSEAPDIKINAAHKDEQWIFSVQDNGRGFEMEHAERIFVIFQRLQGRAEADGTGIGLALCKRIVERHNGKIWAESAPGEGSTFYFSLPQPVQQLADEALKKSGEQLNVAAP